MIGQNGAPDDQQWLDERPLASCLHLGAVLQQCVENSAGQGAARHALLPHLPVLQPIPAILLKDACIVLHDLPGLPDRQKAIQLITLTYIQAVLFLSR